MWTGDRFGVAWSDRREATRDATNYEIYFNLANIDGTKRGADVRITRAEGFSINESLAGSLTFAPLLFIGLKHTETFAAK